MIESETLRVKNHTLTRTTDMEEAALTFAQAHHRWLLLSMVPQSWTDPERQRTLATAFLDFHAAKLALVEPSGAFAPGA